MNQSYPFSVIALDVGGTKIAGAVVLFEKPGQMPQVLHAMSVPTDAMRGGKAVLGSLVEVAQTLLASANRANCANLEEPSVVRGEEPGTSLVPHTDLGVPGVPCGGQGTPLAPLVGIGVGTAGCVDAQRGTVSYANNLMPGYTGQPLAAALELACHLPVAVMGDVHAHALGEARWGSARKAASCLVVAVGTGLGGAYVEGGRVLRGAHGAAGHLGHSLHRSAGDRPCSCNKLGHTESITSGTAIGALYQGCAFADEAFDPSIGGEEVTRRALAGEVHAQETLALAGRYLGEALGSWANIFDPEIIILSGSVCAAGPQWRRGVDAGFAAQALEPLLAIPLIEAALGGDAPLIGAAENLIDYVSEATTAAQQARKGRRTP